MQNHENFILLGANTIIIILVLVMLFRMQDNKIKTYLKKSEKKLDYFIKNLFKVMFFIRNEGYSNYEIINL